MNPERTRYQALSFRSLPVGLFVLVLTGCLGAGVVSPDRPAEVLLPPPGDTVVPGITDRETVSRTLGIPMLSSSFWRMAIYREETTQHETAVALTPVPIPFAVFTDKLERLTLVVYDTEDRVAEVASGIVRRPPRWRSASPIAPGHPWLSLRASDLQLSVMSNVGRTDLLLAGPASRDAYLYASRTAPHCTLVLTCAQGGCGERVAIDGGPPQPFPARLSLYPETIDATLSSAPLTRAPGHPWLDTLVPFLLPPGTHEITFSSESIAGRHHAQVACAAGDVVHLTVSATLTRGLRAFERWSVDIAPTASPDQRGRPLLLWYSGRWFVDPEMGR